MIKRPEFYAPPQKEQNAAPEPTTSPYESTFKFNPNKKMMSLEPDRCDALNREACSKEHSASPQINTTDRNTQSTQQSPKMKCEHQLLDHINREACSGEPLTPYESIAPYVPLEPTAPEPIDFLSLQTTWSLKRSGFTEKEIGEAVIEASRWDSKNTE
ncbi:hypothetical protein [Candidatus Regiella insecticola]|uniref:hypothetical protein n=1 Tax=Candidatus Regiella insecticola TaxID=138073 RepID=UPI000586B315|nr:hypothetical protein [Candidatus Regiella insecticola]